MILQLGNYNLFKTQLPDTSISDRVLADIANKFPSTFASPISGLDLNGTVALYSGIIEQMKTELGLSGQLVSHQAWVNNYKPNEWIDPHAHSIPTDGIGFTAIHYIQYTSQHNPTYFVIDDQQQPLPVNQNDILIYPRELVHGTVGNPEASDNRITLVFDFSLV
jgi:hypothetical protein